MKKILMGFLAILLLVSCSEDKRLFQKARLAASKGHYSEAVQMYSQLIKHNPKHYAALINRGVLLERLPVKDIQERNRNRELAETDYLAAIGVNPSVPEVFNNLGALYIDMKRNLDAVYYLTEALNNNPRYFTALVNRAIANYNLGRSLAALSDFNQAAKIRPDDPLLLLNRALVYYDMKQYESAALDLEHLIAIDPDNARAYLEHARVMNRMGYPANAYADLEEAVTIQPSYALAYYYMADLMFRKGEKDYALGLLIKSKELAQEYAPAYELMGDMLAMEDPVSATANYMAAKKLDPANSTRYDAKIRLMRSEAGRERVMANRFFPKD